MPAYTSPLVISYQFSWSYGPASAILFRLLGSMYISFVASVLFSTCHFSLTSHLPHQSPFGTFIPSLFDRLTWVRAISMQWRIGYKLFVYSCCSLRIYMMKVGCWIMYVVVTHFTSENTSPLLLSLFLLLNTDRYASTRQFYYVSLSVPSVKRCKPYPFINWWCILKKLSGQINLDEGKGGIGMKRVYLKSINRKLS